MSEFILVPNAARPRLLVPSGAPKAAAAAVRRYSEPRSRLARLRTRAVALALTMRIDKMMMRDRVQVYSDGDGGSIETYLREVLAEHDLVVSLPLGPARANRKPVLQLLTNAGATRAFVKVGINDLTRRLIRAEADCLGQVAKSGLAALTAPAVLYHGQWRELEVLVLSPLPVWHRRSAFSSNRLVAAMDEVARVGGTTTAAAAASGYWADLLGRVSKVPDGAPARTLAEIMRNLTRRAESTTVTLGSWHGDWSPWNMATLPDTILLWDWERFAAGVPLGFDALHYTLQDLTVGQRRDPSQAVAQTLTNAPAILRPFGVSAEAAMLTAAAYLTDIAVRYMLDGQAEAGARLGSPEHWLLPPLLDEVSRL